MPHQSTWPRRITPRHIPYVTLPDLGSTLRVERELSRTPFGPSWAARAEDDTALRVVQLAPEIDALLPDRERAFAALSAIPIVPDPALLPVLDTRRTVAGALCLVLPLDESPTAEPRVTGRAPTMPSAEVARVGVALARGLAAAHAAGVRHGLVVPAFVHLGADGAARLACTGVVDALVRAGADPGALASALGARGWTPPELLAGAPADARTDVHALGATLYALLTGIPPYGGRTTSHLMAAVLADMPLTGEVPAIDRDAAAAAHAERTTTALLRAVERAPDDRWPTMAAFIAALEGRTPTPLPEPLPPPSPRSRGGCLTMLVIAALGAGMVAMA